jgi:hypothetical protein
VAVGLRRAATRKQLDQRERKPVDKAANYIENNQERLRYDQALAQGLSIATGVIEGACRHWSRIGWTSRGRVMGLIGPKPSSSCAR